MAKIEKLNGFDFMMADLTRDSFLANTPEGNHILRLYSGDAGKRTEAISYFIGRGKGLTPSGDDLLVGALAADAASGDAPGRYGRPHQEAVIANSEADYDSK